MRKWEIDVNSYGFGKVLLDEEDISDDVEYIQITMEAGKATTVSTVFLNNETTVKTEEVTE